MIIISDSDGVCDYYSRNIGPANNHEMHLQCQSNTLLVDECKIPHH